MRRTEVLVATLVLAAISALTFWGAQGALAGLVGALVVVVLGSGLAWFALRRCRAWRYRERNEDLIVGAACWCSASPWCPMAGCSSSR